MTTFLREAFRVKRRSYPERIRAALFLAIKRTAANLDACVKLPGKDFSRTRKLPLQAMLLMLIGMGSGSLSKELYDWFGYTSSTATASAFVQQRNKIRPEAVKMIFNEFCLIDDANCDLSRLSTFCSRWVRFTASIRSNQ